ncbi:hypothetical protein GCM10010329_03170 [Streptomyces spiroverticillatus]|uniref:Uncharacterized protein n=1 Tax=Streptomyces finlayi TaxID=67296 RepID=A0A918WSC8_9ACTN|nr:hypothetical protein GCM10010329_03170 [Streptomyces spiroverticillatus]GHC78169.1 hypothetical protein GCM10010334_03150 [Streptomyces finlayi]
MTMTAAPTRVVPVGVWARLRARGAPMAIIARRKAKTWRHRAWRALSWMGRLGAGASSARAEAVGVGAESARVGAGVRRRAAAVRRSQDGGRGPSGEAVAGVVAGWAGDERAGAGVGPDRAGRPLARPSRPRGAAPPPKGTAERGAPPKGTGEVEGAPPKGTAAERASPKGAGRAPPEGAGAGRASPKGA